MSEFYPLPDRFMWKSCYPRGCGVIVADSQQDAEEPTSQNLVVAQVGIDFSSTSRENMYLVNELESNQKQLFRENELRYAPSTSIWITLPDTGTGEEALKGVVLGVEPYDAGYMIMVLVEEEDGAEITTRRVISNVSSEYLRFRPRNKDNNFDNQWQTGLGVQTVSTDSCSDDERHDGNHDIMRCKNSTIKRIKEDQNAATERLEQIRNSLLRIRASHGRFNHRIDPEGDLNDGASIDRSLSCHSGTDHLRSKTDSMSIVKSLNDNTSIDRSLSYHSGKEKSTTNSMDILRNLSEDNSEAEGRYRYSYQRKNTNSDGDPSSFSLLSGWELQEGGSGSVAADEISLCKSYREMEATKCHAQESDNRNQGTYSKWNTSEDDCYSYEEPPFANDDEANICKSYRENETTEWLAQQPDKRNRDRNRNADGNECYSYKETPFANDNNAKSARIQRSDEETCSTTKVDDDDWVSYGEPFFVDENTLGGVRDHDKGGNAFNGIGKMFRLQSPADADNLQSQQDERGMNAVHPKGQGAKHSAREPDKGNDIMANGQHGTEWREHCENQSSYSPDAAQQKEWDKANEKLERLRQRWEELFGKRDRNRRQRNSNAAASETEKTPANDKLWGWEKAWGAVAKADWAWNFFDEYSVASSHKIVLKANSGHEWRDGSGRYWDNDSPRERIRTETNNLIDTLTDCGDDDTDAIEEECDVAQSSLFDMDEDEDGSVGINKRDQDEMDFPSLQKTSLSNLVDIMDKQRARFGDDIHAARVRQGCERLRRAIEQNEKSLYEI